MEINTHLIYTINTHLNDIHLNQILFEIHKWRWPKIGKVTSLWKLETWENFKHLRATKRLILIFIHEIKDGSNLVHWHNVTATTTESYMLKTSVLDLFQKWPNRLQIEPSGRVFLVETSYEPQSTRWSRKFYFGIKFSKKFNFFAFWWVIPVSTFTKERDRG